MVARDVFEVIDCGNRITIDNFNGGADLTPMQATFFILESYSQGIGKQLVHGRHGKRAGIVFCADFVSDL